VLVRAATGTQFRSYLPAVSMTLVSGAVMVLGGYLFHDHGRNVAGLVMIPAGPLISIAFAFADRPGDRRPPRPLKITVPLIFSLLLPSPPGDLTLARSLLVSALSLIAGAAMAAAGYAAAAWSLLLVAPLILLGGAVIGLAFIVLSGGSSPASGEAGQSPTAR
jgi:hypothetical protein